MQVCMHGLHYWEKVVCVISLYKLSSVHHIQAAKMTGWIKLSKRHNSTALSGDVLFH